MRNLAADPARAETLLRLRALLDEWIVLSDDQGGAMEDPLDIARGYADPRCAGRSNGKNAKPK